MIHTCMPKRSLDCWQFKAAEPVPHWVLPFITAQKGGKLTFQQFDNAGEIGINEGDWLVRVCEDSDLLEIYADVQFHSVFELSAVAASHR